MDRKLRISPLLGAMVLFISIPMSAAILDDFPNAQAAYSLRRLSSSYLGPAINVQRSSDNQTKDIYFTNDGVLDTADLLSFVGSANGGVIKWYSQIPGHSAMTVPGDLLPPLIVENGNLITSSNGKPRMKFFRADGLRSESKLPVNIQSADITVHMLLENNVMEGSGIPAILQVKEFGNFGLNSFGIGGGGNIRFRCAGTGFGDAFTGKITNKWTIATFAVTSNEAQMYQNHELVADGEVVAENYSESFLNLGIDAKQPGGAWEGYVGELIIYSYIKDISGIRGRTDDMNSYWETGPADYNRNAQLPQKYPYQVVLYDWLETIKIPDLDLPTGTLSWDGFYSDPDDLADKWIFFGVREAATLSRVTRQESKYLVLNDGAGSGIEATPGEIRLLHHAGGHNQRSWGNEPAYWYEMSLKNSDGSNGNPYYKQRPLCMRAMVITAVDMLMYDDAIDSGSSLGWNDMHGKAMYSWAYALYACRDELTTGVVDAFEAGLKRHMEFSIKTGIRDANTNMDMFPVEGAAKIAKNTNNADVRETAHRTVKRLLLGDENGVLGSKHDVWAGAYFPAGYIGENDMADGFYNGESFYHITGAWSHVYDLPGWNWVGEVLKQMSLWRMYQAFPYPDRPFHYDGGAGYSGRTGADALTGQASAGWRDKTAAAMIPEARPLLNGFKHPADPVPSESKMVGEINTRINNLSEVFGIPYTDPPPKWSGWSPWPKEYPYSPPSGWYSKLKALFDSNDPTTIVPIEKPNGTFSKAFGGYPTGMEFWSYRNNNDGRDFGWFVEGDAQQGTYGGWYGGKVETFWIRDMGPVLISRHGKSGCLAEDSEDSSCWDMIDKWGTTHVWGRDENGIAFSPVHEKGRELTRTAVYTPEENPVSVEVTTHLNDPYRQKKGEERDEAIEGQLTIINRFEAISNGLLVSHTIKSNRADQARELYASIPVFIGLKPEDSVTIEYWDGSAYKTLGTTLQNTIRVRIGRVTETYGQKFAYINFYVPQNVRLSDSEYKDPYQTSTRLRNVLVDLHGSPGIAKTIPSEISLLYGINTTDIPGKRIMVAWAGPDKAVPFQTEYTLSGGAYLGGTPINEVDVQLQWEYVEGPSDVTIQSPFSGETNVTFSEPGTYVFKLSATFEDSTSVDYLELTLMAAQPQNYVPRFVNMFNPNQGPLEIPYVMGSTGGVEIRIYNQLNELVTTLINDSKPAGEHTINWDGRNAASGVYKIWFDLAGDKMIKKCVLIK